MSTLKDNNEIQWTSEKAARLWAYYSGNPAYEGAYFSHNCGGYVIDYIRRHISLSGRRVLDFGCGPGYFLDHLVKAIGCGNECFGLDFSANSIKNAQARLKGKILPENIAVVNVLPSNYSEGSFDVVIALEVVEHLNDQELEGMLIEACRLLKKGGFLFLTTPNSEDLNASKVACPDCGCVFHLWQHVRSWSVQTLPQSVERFGFKTIKIDQTCFESFPKRIIRMLKLCLGRKVTRPNLVYIGKRI